MVQFYDKELSAPLRPNQVEDETGATGEDKTFRVGSAVQAPWTDGILYQGIIEFESGTV